MTVEKVDPLTLKEWLDAGQAVLVDVREPSEYASEHIEGATLVPLGHIRRASVPQHKGRKLVIMCRMGARGQSACNKLRQEMPAHEKIYNLEGGIVAWKKADLPVTTPPSDAPSGGGGFFSRLFAKRS